jgi:hypothetical protein
MLANSRGEVELETHLRRLQDSALRKLRLYLLHIRAKSVLEDVIHERSDNGSPIVASMRPILCMLNFAPDMVLTVFPDA